jgi:hypothetical protein
MLKARLGKRSVVFGSVKDMAARLQDKWLVWFLIVIAIVLLGYFVKDYRSTHRFGWDARLVCAGVEAHADGLDPYYVPNLKVGSLPYLYLPVTLDIFRPLCWKGFLPSHFGKIYFGLAALSAFLLSAFSFSGQRVRNAFPKTLYVFGGFIGFEWTLRTGNIVILSGLLTALALYLFYRGFSLQEENAQDPRSGLLYGLGAVAFGSGLSIKIVFFPILIALYFFPLARTRKIALMIVAGSFFIMPFLVSFLFYRDLFFSWVGAISGWTHKSGRDCGVSLFCIGQALAGGVLDFNHYISYLTPGALLLQALVIALILGPLSWWVVWLVKQEYADNGKSFLRNLDQLLIDNSHFAMRVATLTMVGLYLCAPRLADYAFSELAILAAMVVADLPAKSLAAILAVTIAAPILTEGADAVAAHDSPFQVSIPRVNQTIAAVFFYGVLLLDLYPAFLRLKKLALRP